MNIGQFLVIFWARRMLILGATVGCLVGALIVCAVLPPRWQSSSRVMLDDLKPDPVTGETITMLGPYIATQIQLVTDYSVTGKVAEQIGWLSDPNLIKAYQSRSAKDQRNFPHWLADIVSQGAKAKLLEGSNILEISYTANTAKGAQMVADALTKAYIDATLDTRHQDAERNAVWYEQQTVKAKEALDNSVAAVTAYEKQNGIVLQDNRTDEENSRLQALTGQSTSLSTPFVPPADSSPAANQLAQIDAELAVEGKRLGPNNPAMQDLHAKRAVVEQLAEKEKTNMAALAAHMATSSVQAYQRAIDEQKSKVIAQSDKIGRLNQLQQDVDLRRAWYQRTNAKASEFREESVASDAGVTPMGSASMPSAPKFPNYVLIIPGSLGLGLAIGVLTSLMMELLGRRVRVADDLSLAGEAPLICLIPGPEHKPRLFAGGPAWRPRWFSSGGAARA